MYTAIEARKKAENSISYETKQQLSAAERLVGRAIENGEMKCWVHAHLGKQAIGKLEELGYKVENRSDQREGSLFLISW